MFSAAAPSHGRKLSIVIMYNGGRAAGLWAGQYVDTM